MYTTQYTAIHNTVDREIFAVKKFSPVAWVAKIKHAKIKYTLRASLRNRQAAKIKRAEKI